MPGRVFGPRGMPVTARQRPAEQFSPLLAVQCRSEPGRCLVSDWLERRLPGDRDHRLRVERLDHGLAGLGPDHHVAGVVASGRGAQLGIFIKGYQALESSRAIGTVVLDKTGTVTTGQMTVTAVQIVPGTSRGDLLRHAGSVESSMRSAGPAAAMACKADGAATPPAPRYSPGGARWSAGSSSGDIARQISTTPGTATPAPS